MGISERWLLFRLKRRDHGACRELVSKYHASLFRYLIYLGADREQAEDITQETYAIAWEKISSVRSSASLRSWLFTVARNALLQKARVRGLQMSDVEDTSDVPHPDPDILFQLEESERDTALRQAVQNLGSQFRELIVLHYFEELSLTQIGSILGVPKGTVKSRLNRALSMLRDVLESKERAHVCMETRETSTNIV